MMTFNETQLGKRVASLEAENEELRDTLQAIRSGEIDALIVGDDVDQHVFTLQGAEQTYRDLVEAMNEGAVSLSSEGLILYCNARFAEIAHSPLEKVIGSRIQEFFDRESLARVLNVLASDRPASASIEVTMKFGKAAPLRVLLSMNRTEIGGAPGYCVVVTDLTERINAMSRLKDINESLEQRVSSRTVDLSKALKRYQESETQFRTLANSIPTLAWMAEPTGEIFWYNERWYEYTGTAEKDMVGNGWLSHSDPKVLPEVTQSWAHSIATGIPFEMTFPLRGANGQYRAFLMRGTPVFGDDQKIVKWFGTNTDIESTVESRRVVEAAKIEAERANETKSAFLANMSHEIRTPLGAIIGFADLLRERDLSADERAQFLDTISRNGRALTRIIDDILDLAKVESGKLDVESVTFSFVDLLNDVVDLFRERAKSQAIFVRTRIDPAMPERIVSDPTRLRQILINIVGNAVKFTNRGGVTISVRVRSGGARRRFEVAVSDTGIGLSAEQKSRLFQPFSQADNSTSRKYGGTGLGLTLSKRLAVALGGDVRIRETPATPGCTFVISFRALVAETAGIMPMLGTTGTCGDATSSRPLAGLKILVADDSEDNQFLIDRILVDHGATVDKAADGLEAFRKGMGEKFDLVLMDIQMPVMDGYAATKALREAGFKWPIVALTAHAMAEERARTREAGCTAHLTKPLVPVDLVATIYQLTRVDQPRA